MLGVARDGLLYGEKKIDSVNVEALAEALYRRNAALVYIEEGVEAGDLEALLRLLAETRRGAASARRSATSCSPAGVDRVTISSIDYTRLVTTDRLTVASRVRPARSGTR